MIDFDPGVPIPLVLTLKYAALIIILQRLVLR